MPAQSQKCFQKCMIPRYFKCKICYQECENAKSSAQAFTLNHCEYQNCGSKPARGKDMGCDPDQIYSLTQTSCIQQCCDNPTYTKFTSQTFDQCILRNIQLEEDNDNVINMVFSVIGGFVLLLIIIRVLWVCCRNRRQRRDSQRSAGQRQQLIRERLLWKNLDEFKEGLQALWDPHKNKQQKCSICLQHYCNCKTQCGHYYHIKCLAEWFKKGKICPDCRSDRWKSLKVICERCRSRYLLLESIAKIAQVQKLIQENKLNCGRCRSIDFNRNESFQSGWA